MGADGAPAPAGVVGGWSSADQRMGAMEQAAETEAALANVGTAVRSRYKDDADYLLATGQGPSVRRENVYSTDVEDVLYRHPAVIEAAVFGIPPALGEAVHAVVVSRST